MLHWVSNASKGGLNPFYTAKSNTAQTLSLSRSQFCNLRLSVAFSQHSACVCVAPTKTLSNSKGRCAGTLGNAGNQYGIDSLSCPEPLRRCHVKSFSLPCLRWLGLCRTVLISCGLRKVKPPLSQWLVKGIFIWKTNEWNLNGNESLSEQPLCRAQKLFVSRAME